jgi:hypothetical protein
MPATQHDAGGGIAADAGAAADPAADAAADGADAAAPAGRGRGRGRGRGGSGRGGGRAGGRARRPAAPTEAAPAEAEAGAEPGAAAAPRRRPGRPRGARGRLALLKAQRQKQIREGALTDYVCTPRETCDARHRTAGVMCLFCACGYMAPPEEIPYFETIPQVSLAPQGWRTGSPAGLTGAF